MKLTFDKPMLKDVFCSFFSSRLIIVLSGYLSSLIIVKGKWQPEGAMPWQNLFFRWDSGWYLSIVQHGYSYSPGEYSSVAFFPLYSLLVSGVSRVFGHPVVAGFLISNIALFFAAVYLYKLVKLDHDDTETASRSVFYMLIFPASFFFSIFYTEGLFLFLSITAFYYARRKKWLIASLLGFFLALTRSVGVLIIIPLLLEYLNIGSGPYTLKSFTDSVKKIKGDILYLLLVPAGLCSFMLYLFLKFGEPFAFAEVQSAWGRKSTIIFSALANFKYEPFYSIIFHGFSYTAMLLIVYLAYRKTRLSYLVYSASLMLIYLSTWSLEAIPRLIGVIFPLYTGLALLGKKFKPLDNIFTELSIMLLAIFVILFTNGYWLT